MPLDPKFTKFSTVSPRLVSYNFIDTITGVAYGVFYAGNASGTNTLISSPTASSWQGITQAGSPTTGDALTLRGTFEFETTFSTSQTIEGDAIAEFSLGLYYVDTANDAQKKANVEIQKNGVALVNGDTIPTTENGNATDTKSDAEAVLLTIPKTHFAIGDTLKMVVKVYAAGQAPSQGVVPGIGTDPAGKNDPGAGFPD